MLRRRRLRFLTYLAPSLPAGLFAEVARRVGAALGLPVTLRLETSTSGPAPGERDPFSAGEADVGFLCAPTYAGLAARRAAVLVPTAPVFDDPRAAGRPVYFAELVVPAESRVTRFADLRGATCVYNDRCSLSGFGSLHALAREGAGPAFFASLAPSGSHLHSLRAVARGRADAAAIDSNVLALAARRDPGLLRRVRVVDSWGPYPVQPIVAAASLPPELRRAIAAALLSLDEGALARWGIARFAPVSEGTYVGPVQA